MTPSKKLLASKMRNFSLYENFDSGNGLNDAHLSTINFPLTLVIETLLMDSQFCKFTLEGLRNDLLLPVSIRKYKISPFDDINSTYGIQFSKFLCSIEWTNENLILHLPIPQPHFRILLHQHPRFHYY